MSRGKYEAAPVRWRAAAVVLIVLVLLAAAIGTSAAYLSMSAANTLSNELKYSVKPSVTVREDNSILVENAGYSVYVRGALTVNWVHQEDDHQQSGNILAVIPEAGKDYKLTVGTGWVFHDGFYYHTAPLKSGDATQPMVTMSDVAQKEGYRLELKIMAQTIQAAGQTDGENPVDAVMDAWGVQP